MERPGEQVHLGKGEAMFLSSCIRECGSSSRLILLAAVFFILSVGRCQDTTGSDNEEESFLWHWSVIRYSSHVVLPPSQIHSLVPMLYESIKGIVHPNI